MSNFKQNPITTTIGILFIVLFGVLLFIPSLYEIPLLGLCLLPVVGILLIRAQDKLVDILTLGLNRFVKDITKPKNETNGQGEV